MVTLLPGLRVDGLMKDENDVKSSARFTHSCCALERRLRLVAGEWMIFYFLMFANVEDEIQRVKL